MWILHKIIVGLKKLHSTCHIKLHSEIQHQLMQKESYYSILDSFREYYSEVARIKLLLQAGQYSQLLSESSEQAAAHNDADLAPAISNYLKTLLQNQYMRIAASSTQAEIDSYKEAQYVMAVLADEIFILELEWPGQEDWEGYLIEAALFNTHSAGQAFFNRLDKLLATRTNSSYEELASVYLLAIRLGFAGQYRDEKGKISLGNYMQKLYRVVGNTKSLQDYAPVFSQAYGQLLSQPLGERLAPLSFWYKAAGIAAAAYLLITYIVWHVSLLPLYDYLG